MPVTDIQCLAQAPCCTYLPQASTSANTHQQQCAWPDATLHNSHARHQALTEHDTTMVWASDVDLTQPAADNMDEPVPAVPLNDNALHSSHYLAQLRQPVQTPCNQLCYSGNSGDMSESAHMPAASASLQGVYQQHNLYAAPSSLLHHQDPAAQQTQPIASFLPPQIIKDSAHADPVHNFSQHSVQSAGHMPVCYSTSQERLAEGLQEPMNSSTSQMIRAHKTHTQPDTLPMPQPATATQSSGLCSAITQGKEHAAVPIFHQAAFPSPGPLNVEAAATSTAWQRSLHGAVNNHSPAPAPAAASAGASAETAATPTTIKAPLYGLATSSQACCDGQQHPNGSSRSPTKPAEVTAGGCVWKRKKNVLEVCVVYIAGVLMVTR